MNDKNPILEVKNLVKKFPINGGFLNRKIADVNAVQDVSFTLNKGETLGLVGESGCGKSTLGRCILRLIEPTSGDVFFKGENIINYSNQQLQNLRRKMQIIFQDPFSSLNPRMSIESILEEPLLIHNLFSNSKDRKDRIHQLAEIVGLRIDSLQKYPHEFSGGQRQRVGIARALAVEPELIICDEPVSALDVSIQAQVINLLMDLQQKFGLSYVFIAHDLKVVEHVSTKIAVMYLGKIVEMSESLELYKNPQHPYTQALLSAIPIPDPEIKKERIILKGDVPSPIHPPKGCHFHPRCPIANATCNQTIPNLINKNDHYISCLLRQ